MISIRRVHRIRRIAGIRILLDDAHLASRLVNLQVAVAIDAPADSVLPVLTTDSSQGSSP